MPQPDADLSSSLTLCATTRLAQTLRGEVPAGRTVWPTRQALTSASGWRAWPTSAAERHRRLPLALDPLPSACCGKR